MLNLQLPINNLSFGNISFGILNELYSRKFNDFVLFDIGQPDLTAFDKRRTDEDFIGWVNDKRRDSLKRFSKKDPGFKLWHISSSESSISKEQNLFTFHELDEITEVEKNILNNQSKVFVSSNYTKEVFIEGGVTVPIIVLPLGFDSVHFHDTGKVYHPKEVTHWSIFGKFENRKRHLKTIKCWINNYGGNYAHILNLSTYNPHLSPEQNNGMLAQVFEGKPKPFNVNIIPFSPTLSEFNEVLGNTDIVIDMSGAEGFSLPSFTAVCLGKHAVIHNNTGMKEWATNENAVLVEPSSKITSKDDIFFRNTGDFNIGNIYEYNEYDLFKGCTEALKRKESNSINLAGKELINRFSWSNCVDEILKNL